MHLASLILPKWKAFVRGNKGPAWVKRLKIFFFMFFTLKYILIFTIINLHKKCDLLRSLCWCSLKDVWMGGVLLQWFFLCLAPSNGLIFWATTTYHTSKDHIFYEDLWLWKWKYISKWKTWKKSILLFSPMSHRCVM